MVVRQILDLNVEVRALVGQQTGSEKRRFFCFCRPPGGIGGKSADICRQFHLIDCNSVDYVVVVLSYLGSFEPKKLAKTGKIW